MPTKTTRLYRLRNFQGGTYEGHFETDAKAWRELRRRYMQHVAGFAVGTNSKSLNRQNVRTYGTVEMFKEELFYGFPQMIKYEERTITYESFKRELARRAK
jgi:hypothetical protein